MGGFLCLQRLAGPLVNCTHTHAHKYTQIQHTRVCRNCTHLSVVTLVIFVCKIHFFLSLPDQMERVYVRRGGNATLHCTQAEKREARIFKLEWLKSHHKLVEVSPSPVLPGD